MSDQKKNDNYIPMDKMDSESSSSYKPQPPPPQPRHSAVSSAANNATLAIISYCASSILMTVTNKYVLSGVDFNLNFFLLCIQSIICIIAVQSCKTLGFINYRDFSSDEAKKWFPISLLLIGMIYTGSKALKFLSIPVYTIFKNLTIILIAYGEVLWFGGSVSGLTLFSFGLMVLSSVVAAWADITHAVSTSAGAGAVSTLNSGYLWMLINCACTASYVLGMRKRIKLTNFKDFDTMFYNNLLSIPILMVSSLLVEDWSSANVAKNFPVDTRNRLYVAMLFSGLSTVFISYASAWCVRVTTSTTYSMVGALNKLPIALSGLMFFGDPVTFPSVSAIAIGFISGIVYALAKIKQNAKPKTGILPTSNPPVSASAQSMRDGFKS
ncbi:GDP-mannose transporter [Trichophyton tonsurans CBS 112818]|uniref:GDP-mannose transporter n=2 Tax=Trichophyton TaxID=5550 RepID=F2PQJ1_TRIEC|nr:GDP-mannose transporter [Trichophyton tonsurans CBS 112818]EGE04159.1 golgi GDP-mannose transporter [Trichophyton equinum CBS 127.97]